MCVCEVGGGLAGSLLCPVYLVCEPILLQTADNRTHRISRYFLVFSYLICCQHGKMQPVLSHFAISKAVVTEIRTQAARRPGSRLASFLPDKKLESKLQKNSPVRTTRMHMMC